MNKLFLGALTALLGLCADQAHAQVFSRPPTTTYGRPGYGGYGYGGLFGPGGVGPYGGSYPGLFGSPFSSGIYGPPSTVSPTAPGVGTASNTGRDSTNSDLASGNITGHPTRFLNYSHYFLNQGGGTTTQTGTSGGYRPSQGLGVLFGAEYARAPAGSAPNRPARSGGGRR